MLHLVGPLLDYVSGTLLRVDGALCIRCNTNIFAGMENEKLNKESSGIVYSCYHTSSREGEHFVPEHTLSFQVKGSLILSDGSRQYASSGGSLRFIKRNQLLKFMKQPPADGDFKSLSFYFNQQILKDFSLAYGITADTKKHQQPVIDINTTPVLKTYIHSLLEYQQNNMLTNKELVNIKLKEGLFLLLQANPELKNILFDFAEPHKIDLEAFMNKNYHFNVRLERFAYLTGRSLATFKRDFQQIFNTSPRHWLQQRRLNEAYFLITQKGKTANNIYLDLGFENLSHFSHSFKKQFGNAPSALGAAC